MKQRKIKKAQITKTEKLVEQKPSRVYGIVGMVALFLLGVIFGYIINGADRINHSNMTKKQCDEVASRIISLSYDNRPETMAELNKIYSQNCVDRKFEQPRALQKAKIKKMPETTCGQIEALLTNRLMPVDDGRAESHVDNAKIYANLSERGCAENSARYKSLAKQELEIARAINDDSLEDKYEATEIVETYKRLQMQAEAEKMIEKAKKLTNPAIDFIIQLEKIIEE